MEHPVVSKTVLETFGKLLLLLVVPEPDDFV